MPRLPSGKEIAISASRLLDLLKTYEESGEPAALGEVRTLADLDSYIDVIFFRHPPAGAVSPRTPEESNLPAGLEPYESGYTLADAAQLMEGWPADDRKAFHAFLAEDRTRKHLVQTLKRVRLARLARAEPTPATILQAMALVDPAALGLEEEPGDIDEPLALDPERLRAYTLVALARIALLANRHPTLYAGGAARFERLRAVIGLVLRQGPGVVEAVVDEQLAFDEVARRVQTALAAKDFSAQTRTWLDRQVWHEVINLWPAIDNDEAQALFPREHDVLEQAWLSPQAASALRDCV